MTSFVEIDGKKFQNVGDAAKLTGYSRDYIGRLAREQKIVATQIGRQWFISIASLQKYAQSAERELKDRQQKLSVERKREREAARRLEEKEKNRTLTERNKNRSRILATFALVLGVGLGVLLNATSLAEISSRNQIASAPELTALPQVAEEFRVATQDVVETNPLDFIDFSQESMTISTMDGDGQGVMLLPSDRDEKLNEEEVRALFSDPVKIVKDKHGNKYVVRTTADGNEERLPFAVVPVVNSEMP